MQREREGERQREREGKRNNKVALDVAKAHLLALSAKAEANQAVKRVPQRERERVESSRGMWVEMGREGGRGGAKVLSSAF